MTEQTSELELLRDVLKSIEILTATGQGLSPQECVEVHLLAAEGRRSDPDAWRYHPETIERLRAALRPDPRASSEEGQ